jgi:hypothetical protein
VTYSSEKDAKDGRQAIVQSGRVVAVDGCNRDFNSISQQRAVLQRAQVVIRQGYAKGQYTEAQYERAKKFYNQQLHKIDLPDCRTAKDIITDDPRNPGTLPVPRYPGDPKDIADTAEATKG